MKYIPITPEILKAIDAAAKEAGSNVNLAEAAGISPSAIGCYLLGKRQNIKESVYSKLFPFIEPYLEEQSHTADFSRTAMDIAKFYDTLAEGDKQEMKMAQREILLKMYRKAAFHKEGNKDEESGE